MRGGSPGEECDDDGEAVGVILSNTTQPHNHHHPYTNMHAQFPHTTLSLGRNRRRQHLALWRGVLRRGSPGEECDAHSEAVGVILCTG